MAQVTTYEPSQPLISGSPYVFPAFLFQTANSQNIRQIPTLGIGDVKISVDGGGYSNITTLPIEVGTTGELTVSLSALETTGATKYITIKFHDVSGSEWTDAVYQIDVDTQEIINLDNLDVAVSTRLSTSSYVAPDNATIGTISTDVQSIESTMLVSTDTRLNFLDAAISSRSTITPSDVWNYVTRTLTSSSGISAADVWTYATRELTGFNFTVDTIKDLDIDAIKAKTDNLPINPASQTNLDVAVSTRLPTSSYTAPDNVTIGLTSSNVLLIPTNPLLDNDIRLINLDTPVSTRLATAGYVAPDNARIVNINAIVETIPTDTLTSTDPRLNALDTTISSRSTLVASDVWANPTRTLTSGGGSGGATAEEVWSYQTRTITGASGLASSIWEYENRTLTNWRNIVTDIWNAVPAWFSKKIEQLIESDLYIYKGVTNKISIVGAGNIGGSSNIVFTVKNKHTDSDAQSILRIEFLNGLTILNGGQYPIGTDASISILDEASGDIEIILNSTPSLNLIPSQKRLYDIKARVGNDVKLVSRGKIDILPDVTNDI